MKKEEFVRKYGEAVYKKKLQQKRDWFLLHHEEENAKTREWNEKHPEEAKQSKQLWRSNHPDKVKKSHQERSRKGGKYYGEKREYERTGIQGERNVIRSKHGKKYRPYKKITAPGSQLHHQWVPGTADYRGVALVEADQHMHGFIDVIQILEGEITLLTEAEIMMEAKQ